jgi:hypothetical protein
VLGGVRFRNRIDMKNLYEELKGESEQKEMIDMQYREYKNMALSVMRNSRFIYTTLAITGFTFTATTL